MPSDYDSLSSSNPSLRESAVDQALADRVNQAAVELQETMDAALLAGLVVEPDFAQVDNRLTRFGTRIDSFVCRVRVYRKLT